MLEITVEMSQSVFEFSICPSAFTTACMTCVPRPVLLLLLLMMLLSECERVTYPSMHHKSCWKILPKVRTKEDDSWRKIHETARQAKRRVPEAAEKARCSTRISMRRTDLKHPKLTTQELPCR